VFGAFTLRVFAPLPVELAPIDAARRWLRTACEGEWTEATAGGCRNFGSWAENPQLRACGIQCFLICMLCDADGIFRPLIVGFMILGLNKD
jgi:hypothetical protein